MGLLGSTQELLLPGSTTREKGAQAAVSAGQVPGPCIDDCRCNSSIFISGVVPPISYSNYHSTLTADSTPQLVPDQRHTACNKLNFLPMETTTVLILNVNLDAGFFYCLDIRLMQEEKPFKIAGKGRWFRIQSAKHLSVNPQQTKKMHLFLLEKEFLLINILNSAGLSL